MSPTLAIATDLVAISILSFGLYHRRHGRRDLLLAFIALNVGVLAVTIALTSAQAGLGLGLGLFGILSIIRLRSDQIAQEEIAYYFISLALGLLGGMHPGAAWVTPALSTLLVAIIFIADHPRVLGNSRRTVLTLDRACATEDEARAALADVLPGNRIRRVILTEVDLVRDVTVVDVRHTAPARKQAAATELPVMHRVAS